jgi:hypothetical protein
MKRIKPSVHAGIVATVLLLIAVPSQAAPEILPDASSTFGLLGLALLGLFAVGRKFRRAA